MTDLDPRVVAEISVHPLHWHAALKHVARLAAECERERCAKVCEPTDEEIISAYRKWGGLTGRDLRCVRKFLAASAAAIRGAKP